MTTQVHAGDRLVPLTRLRTAVARTVTASAAVPQFTVEYEVDVRGLAEMRTRWDSPVSVTDMVHAATARALRAHPRLNAALTNDGIVEYGSINLGFAIAHPEQDGLLVPAILDADRLSLLELAGRRRALTEAAAGGRLRPADLLSTTFTVSNLGPTGVSRFRALVLPPQAAILAVAGTRSDGTMTLALSCDHRVVDGQPAALFLREVTDRLRDATWMHDHPGDAA